MRVRCIVCSLLQHCILRGTQPSLIRLLAIGIQPRQRHIAARLIHIGYGARPSPLLQQPHAFPDEGGGAKAVVFGYASAYGVVVKAGGLRAFVLGAGSPGGHYLDEVVFFVPAEGLRGVFARQFADEAAVTVVEVTFVFVHLHQVVARMTKMYTTLFFIWESANKTKFTLSLF